MAIVGIMDSGSGGLSVYREIRKVLPESRYMYWSDNAYCPYGDKPASFIVERNREITSFFLSKGCDSVVIACNTATSAAVATLRSEFDIPFVAMEPAVKPAALGTGTGVIGILATAGTLKGSKYLAVKGRYADGVRIEERVGKGFVELVESGNLSGMYAESVVRESLLPLLDAGADRIVLGCTHYPFLLPVMEKIASGYSGVRFIDPAPAVARRLVEVLSENGIDPVDPNPGIELHSSGNPASMERIFSIL